MKMTLAHALKLKKRLVGKIADLENKIRSGNVFYKENEKYNAVIEPKVDIMSDWKEYLSLKESIAKLKTLIARTNAEAGISSLVYEMEEKKSFVCFLKRINVNVRAEREPDGNGGIIFLEKETQISKEEIDSLVERTKLEIENLQDIIDERNGTITIDFE